MSSEIRWGYLAIEYDWLPSDENVLRLHVDCDSKFKIGKLFSNGKDRATRIKNPCLNETISCTSKYVT
jgi:hypothetical protein